MAEQQLTVADNETFITLLRIARNDREVRDTLITIISLPSMQRKAVLNRLIRDMQAQDAPADFVLAISELMADDVADQAGKLLQGE